MNEFYNLTDSNSYDEELNIVCIKLSDMEDFNVIIIPRFEIKVR